MGADACECCGARDDPIRDFRIFRAMPHVLLNESMVATHRLCMECSGKFLQHMANWVEVRRLRLNAEAEREALYRLPCDDDEGS